MFYQVKVVYLFILDGEILIMLLFWRDINLYRVESEQQQ